MDTVLVFLPINIKKQSPGFLLGFYKEEFSNKSIYVLTTQDFHSKKDLDKSPFYIVGSYSTKKWKSEFALKNISEDVWIHVKCTESEVFMGKCCIKKKSHDLRNCIVIFYDVDNFNCSELLLHPQNLFEIDHFRTLASNLQLRETHKTDCFIKIHELFVNNIVYVFTHIYNTLSKCSCVIKYSTLALHLMNYSHSIVWIGETYKKTRTINLKVGNYIVAVILDILAGLLVYYTVTSWKNAVGIFDTLSNCAESVIDSIYLLVNWLMGSPAGLKLNQPLSSLLGSLVFYYLEIWRNFLRLVQPVLEISFFVLIKLGFLGLTFQLAVFTDIFAIISFHVYCIYVYAARLYEIQAKGLCSLSRLVLGRKRNPEPGRIDSCPYSTEELLIGTISFAVLLFLLPTTLVYYIVFTGMRIGVLLIRGLMTRTIYFMQTLPMYSTFLWLFFPCYTATTVKLTPLHTDNSVHGSLIAKLTNSSWLQTTKHSIPEAVPSPAPVIFGETISKIARGKLI